jgi:hypothetical protein
MPGRRRLSKNKPRLLGRHDGWRGREYDREWSANGGAELTSQVLRNALGEACVRKVRWIASSQALREAERQREKGRGRRPSTGAIERLKRREGIDSVGYRKALVMFWELARERSLRPASVSELVATWVRGG